MTLRGQGNVKLESRDCHGRGYEIRQNVDAIRYVIGIGRQFWGHRGKIPHWNGIRTGSGKKAVSARARSSAMFPLRDS